MVAILLEALVVFDASCTLFEFRIMMKAFLVIVDSMGL